MREKKVAALNKLFKLSWPWGNQTYSNTGATRPQFYHTQYILIRLNKKYWERRRGRGSMWRENDDSIDDVTKKDWKRERKNEKNLKEFNELFGYATTHNLWCHKYLYLRGNIFIYFLLESKQVFSSFHLMNISTVFLFRMQFIARFDLMLVTKYNFMNYAIKFLVILFWN